MHSIYSQSSPSLGATSKDFNTCISFSSYNTTKSDSRLLLGPNG